MNAYFRMNNDIFMCPAALELSEKRKGDSNSSMRVLIFIRILCYSIAGGVCFVDAKSLSAMLNVALKQAQNVWDVCIKHSVLRKDGYGYSAREWLCESGFFGAYGDRKEAESVPVPAESVPETKEKDKSYERFIEVLNDFIERYSGSERYGCYFETYPEKPDRASFNFLYAAFCRECENKHIDLKKIDNHYDNLCDAIMRKVVEIGEKNETQETVEKA